MTDGSIRIKTSIMTDGAKFGMKELESIVNSGSKKVASGMNTMSGGLKKLAGLIISTFSITAIAKFSKDAVNEYSKMQSSMIGLQSIMEGQGKSFDRAKKFIDNYIKDGLIPMNNAVTAYKNLAMRGYSDEQIQSTLTSLKDASAFGRQASLSMGEAVQSATEGLKNENSILVDNAGVTKNVSIMWKDYANSIDKGVDSLTKQQKIQAEVNGILNETRYQIGDSVKYANTYAGQISYLSASFLRLKQNIGILLQGLFGNIAQGIGSAINALNIFVQAIGKVIGMFTGKNPLLEFNNSLKDVENGTAGVSNGFGDINDGIDKATGKSKKLKKELAGFDSINKLSKPDSSSSDSGVGSTGGLSDLGNVGNIDLGLDNQFQSANAEVNRLAKNIKSFLDTTIKTLKKFEPLIKGLTAGGIILFIGSLIGKSKLLMGVITALCNPFKIVGGFISGFFLAIKAGLPFMQTLKLVGTAFIGTIKAICTNIGMFFKSMSSMQKTITTVAGLVAIFITVKNSIKDLTLGNKNLGESLMNIIPIAGLVGIALYSMLGPWGLILGAVVAVVAGVVGYQEALKDLAKSKIYGELELSAEELSSISDSIGASFKSQSDNIDSFKSKMADLNTEFEKSSNTVEVYGVKFGLLGQKISEEDVPNILSSIDTLAKDSEKIIDESTTNSLMMWSDMFKNTTSVSKEEQKNILQSISKTGEAQKSEIKAIQDTVSKTYEEAIKTRGYLTDEEYNYISSQLARLREITNVEMMKTNANIEINKRQINDKTIQLSEKGYNDLLDSISKGETEASDTAKKIQNQAYIDAEIARKNAIDQKTMTEQEAQNMYLSMLKTADENYRQEMSKTEETTIGLMKGTRDKIQYQKSELIKEMKDGGTDLEKEQLKQLNELEKGLNGKISTYTSTLFTMGYEGAKAFNRAFNLNGATDKLNTFTKGVRANTNSVLNNLAKSYNSLQVGSGGKIYYSSFPPISSMIPRFAKGGIVNRPTQAIIGEAGAEAVLPLRNNTGWMKDVAKNIALELATSISNDSSNRPIILQNIMDGEIISKRVFEIKKDNDFAMNGG